MCSATVFQKSQNQGSLGPIFKDTAIFQVYMFISPFGGSSQKVEETVPVLLGPASTPVVHCFLHNGSSFPATGHSWAQGFFRLWQCSSVCTRQGKCWELSPQRQPSTNDQQELEGEHQLLQFWVGTLRDIPNPSRTRPATQSSNLLKNTPCIGLIFFCSPTPFPSSESISWDPSQMKFYLLYLHLGETNLRKRM